MIKEYYDYHLNSNETFKYDNSKKTVSLKIFYKTENDYNKIVEICKTNFPKHSFDFIIITKQKIFPHLNQRDKETRYIMAQGNLNEQFN